MLIKIIKNNIESEWFELTKAHHRALLKDMPDEVLIDIEELYPGSPDKGRLVKLDFMMFTILAREFVLEKNRQEKWIERHIDDRPLEEISYQDYKIKPLSLEEEFERQELKCRLAAAKETLTPVQKRRLEFYIEDKCSMREIAAREGVHNTAVEDSVHAAFKKIKKFLD